MPTADTERASPGQRPPRLFAAELFLLAARTRPELLALLADVRAHLGRPKPASLQDLAFTLSRAYEPDMECLAVIAGSHADLEDKLSRALGKLAASATVNMADRDGVYYFQDKLGGSKRAFLFPGENAQYPNMLADLCLNFPEVRRAFDLADAACAEAGDDFLPSALNFPPPGSETQGAGPEEMAEWEKAIVLIHTANTAMKGVLERLELLPDAVVGHSFGEPAALEMTGVIRVAEGDERLRYSREAYLHVRELSVDRDLPRGRLLTVGGVERPQLEKLLAQYPDALQIAMENCPHQYVLCAAGPEMDRVIADAEKQLTAEGALCAPLPIRRPYHTSFFEPAFALERAYTEKMGMHPPQIEVYSCSTADRFPDDPSEIVEVAARHWMSPVRFQQTIEKMYDRGFRIFVDVGPRGSLCAFVGDILRDKPHLAVALDRPQRTGMLQLLHGLGMLAAHGVPLRTDYLHERWSSREIDFRAAPAVDPPSAVVSLPIFLPQMKAEGIVVKGREPALQTAAMHSSAAPGPQRSAGDRFSKTGPSPTGVPAPAAASAAMMGYLDTMDQFLSVQRTILDQLLTAPSPRPASAGAVARGELELGDPLAALLPEELRPQGDSVRLVDLATHTSGMPDIPSNLVRDMSRFVVDYSGYDREDLSQFLRTFRPESTPGETYVYSNAGFGVLGFALAERRGSRSTS